MKSFRPWTDEDREKAAEARRRKWLYQNAIKKLMAMKPSDRDTYEPETGHEELVKLSMDSARENKKLAIVVLKEFRDTLGEKVNYNAKENKDRNEDKPTIINDIPQSFSRKNELEN